MIGRTWAVPMTRPPCYGKTTVSSMQITPRPTATTPTRASQPSNRSRPVIGRCRSHSMSAPRGGSSESSRATLRTAAGMAAAVERSGYPSRSSRLRPRVSRRRKTTPSNGHRVSGNQYERSVRPSTARRREPNTSCHRSRSRPWPPRGAARGNREKQVRPTKPTARPSTTTTGRSAARSPTPLALGVQPPHRTGEKHDPNDQQPTSDNHRSPELGSQPRQIGWPIVRPLHESKISVANSITVSFAEDARWWIQEFQPSCRWPSGFGPRSIGNDRSGLRSHALPQSRPVVSADDERSQLWTLGTGHSPTGFTTKSTGLAAAAEFVFAASNPAGQPFLSHAEEEQAEAAPHRH